MGHFTLPCISLSGRYRIRLDQEGLWHRSVLPLAVGLLENSNESGERTHAVAFPGPAVQDSFPWRQQHMVEKH